MAVVVFPFWARLRYLNGLLFAVHGDLEEGLGELKVALKNNGRSPIIFFEIGQLEINQGRFDRAATAFQLAVICVPNWSNAIISLAQMKLLQGEENNASDLLLRGISIDSTFGMAHQNISARYDRYNYVRKPLDVSGSKEIALYDAYNYTGQLLVHAGRSGEGVRFYGEALKIQKKLQTKISLPLDIVKKTRDLPGFDPDLPVRILPYEWVAQIGHIGMLDTYKKIQMLGWRPRANDIVLAPKTKIANRALLECWSQHFLITYDTDLINDLFPYQRVLGDTFNAHLTDGGEVLEWCEIGAKAHILWDQEKKEPLIRLSNQQIAQGKDFLEVLGIPRDAWFVALHVRDKGYYGESFVHTYGHRNALLENYYSAIEYITSKGGWVIRMGDPSMKRLRKMKQVVDYAHLTIRQDWMDVFLWSQARFFLGTTSGPTNAAISFGTPCALVNCLSNYCQLWNKNVIFSLKPFWSTNEKRFLKLLEFSNDPIRGKIFNLKILSNEGILPIENSAEDILGVVRELIEKLDGNLNVQSNTKKDSFSEMQIKKFLWGNAQPSIDFFNNNHSKFF